MRPPRDVTRACPRGSIAVAALRSALALAPPAAGGELKPLARIAIGDGVLHEAFAFADGGGQFAYAQTDGEGKTRVFIGAPGGKKPVAVDVTSFSAAPERILYVGGYWYVIANEGTRRAAIIGKSGRIENQIGAFGEAFVSDVRGRTFVTVTDKGERAGGHVYAISAYRPNGALLGGKTMTIGGDGTIAGSDGLVFVAFTGGYLRALVKKPGRYDAKRDARGGTQIAVLDVLSGKTGPGRNLPDLTRFMRFAEKRAERPGLEAFVRPDDDARGLELVGPADKTRPLALPSKYALYEAPSLQQQASGGRLFFSLTVDPLNPDQVAAGKKGARVLHVFEAAVGTAKATLLGQVTLGETQSYSWAAGGSRVAVLKRSQKSGGNEIQIFGR
jgi:hypothetical protein